MRQEILNRLFVAAYAAADFDHAAGSLQSALNGTSRFCGLPSFAPSRSTTCIHARRRCIGEPLGRSARDRRSKPSFDHNRPVSGVPLCRPRRSIAGNISIVYDAPLANVFENLSGRSRRFFRDGTVCRIQFPLAYDGRKGDTVARRWRPARRRNPPRRSCARSIRNGCLVCCTPRSRGSSGCLKIQAVPAHVRNLPVAHIAAPMDCTCPLNQSQAPRARRIPIPCQTAVACPGIHPAAACHGGLVL